MALEAYANALRGICTRHGISLTAAATEMMTAPVLEARQHRKSFDLDQAIRSAELVIMNMAGRHRGLHNAQSVVRAFSETFGRIPPFSEVRALA